MPRVEWAGESFELSPARGLHWPRRATLIIADPHFGKAAAYRHLGVPVPDGATDADLARLTALLDETDAGRLVILGDFFHAASSRSPETLASLHAWRDAHPDLEVLLVRGNHDRHAGDPPDTLAIRCVDEPHDDGPVDLAHDPAAARPKRPTLAGHVHPTHRIRDPLGGSIGGPCFHFGAHVATLPAFGSFTGGRRVDVAPGDQVFVLGDVPLFLADAAAHGRNRT